MFQSSSFSSKVGSSHGSHLSKNSASLVHKQLEDEAEKLRQWKLQTELDLKERANKCEELVKNNDRLNRELNEEKQRTGSLRSHNQCLKQDLEALEGVITDSKKTVELMKNFARKVKDSFERGEMSVARVEAENQTNQEDLKKMESELESMRTSLKTFGEAYEAVESEKSKLLEDAMHITEQFNLTSARLTRSESQKEDLIAALASSNQEVDQFRVRYAEKNEENAVLVEKCGSIRLESETNFKHLVGTTLERNLIREISSEMSFDLVGITSYGMELWVILENCLGKYLSEVSNNAFMAEILSEVMNSMATWIENLNDFVETVEGNLNAIECFQEREIASLSFKLSEAVDFISHVSNLWIQDVKKFQTLKTSIDACYTESTLCVKKLKEENHTLKESLETGQKDANFKILELQNGNQELNSLNVSLNDSIAEKDAEIASLVSGFETAKNDIVQLKLDIVSKDGELHQLRNSIEVIENEKEKLLQDFKELKSISDTAAENSANKLIRKTSDFEARELLLVTEVSELHDLVGELRLDKDEAQKLGSQLKIENESLRSELRALRHGSEEQDRNINVLETLKMDFEARLHTLSNENSLLVKRLEEKSLQAVEMEKQKHLLAQEVDKLRNDNNALGLQSSDDQRVLEELQKSNNEWREKVSQLGEEKATIVSEFEKLSAEKEKLLEELKSTKTLCSTREGDLEATIEKVQHQISALNEEKIGLEESLKATRDNSEEQQAQIGKLEQKLAMSKRSIEGLEGEAHALCEKLQNQQFTQECLENGKKYLQETLDRVMQDRNKRFQETNAEIKDLNEVNLTLKKEITLLKEENETLKNVISSQKLSSSKRLSQEKRSTPATKADPVERDSIGTRSRNGKFNSPVNQAKINSQASAVDKEMEDSDSSDDDDDEDPLAAFELTVQPLPEEPQEASMDTSEHIPAIRSSPRLRNARRSESVERASSVSVKTPKRPSRSMTPRRNLVEKKDDIPLARQSPGSQVLKNKEKMVACTPVIFKTPTIVVPNTGSASVVRFGDKARTSSAVKILPSKASQQGSSIRSGCFSENFKAKLFAHLATPGGTPKSKMSTPLASLTAQVEDICLASSQETASRGRRASSKTKQG